MTMEDGSHVPLSAETAKELLDAAKAAQADRAKRMPDDHSALKAMFDAWQRLKELGWRDGDHAPKDGTTFESIEIGSTGIFDCSYSLCGFWVADGGDMWPSHPILFRLKPEDEAKRKAKMAEAAARFRDEATMIGRY
ncbi:hypothetical protein CAK95_24280 [Pseudorhodoplanes sinuspersici]|uniref:Uncharacterized protein n=2 Tax=Pseudorhodoplanes sinuspersici TaxID=1235591 RepID=A0A1W6ZWU6_9HYPH|nr:hypothetical protein CAK95_24280 [Pseudorhodoplanes sinuspersici]